MSNNRFQQFVIESSNESEEDLNRVEELSTPREDGAAAAPPADYPSEGGSHKPSQQEHSDDSSIVFQVGTDAQNSMAHEQPSELHSATPPAASAPPPDSPSQGSAAGDAVSQDGAGTDRQHVVHRKVTVRRKRGDTSEIVSVTEEVSTRQSSEAPRRLSPRAQRSGASTPRTPRDGREAPAPPARATRGGGEAIAPGRTTSSVSATAPPPPPPPGRVSPRAARAANSRGSSRATSPRSPKSATAEPPLVPPRDSRPSSRQSSARNLDDAREGGEAGTEHPSRGATPRSAQQQPPSQQRREGEVDSSSEAGFQHDAAEAPFAAGTRQTSGTSLSFRFEEGERGASAGAQRRPVIPSPSELDDSAPTPCTIGEDGAPVPVHRAKVARKAGKDGEVKWYFVPSHRGDRLNFSVREIPAPPKRLSRRAQDIMAAKRKALEHKAKRRRSDAAKAVTSSHRRQRQVHSLPNKESYVTRQRQTQVAPAPETARNADDAALSRGRRWGEREYEESPEVQRVIRESTLRRERNAATPESLLRVLQPIQVGEEDPCMCAHYPFVDAEDVALERLLQSREECEAHYANYLTLQSMSLEEVNLGELDGGSRSPPRRRRSINPQPKEKPKEPEPTVAADNGLWCKVTNLGADAALDGKRPAPRRVVRICGGEHCGTKLEDQGAPISTQCYELLMFPQENVNLDAIHTGSEGLTLGQMVSPPCASFPLTPRLVRDPLLVREYKRKLIAKGREVILVNNEENRETFADLPPEDTDKFITLTLVTISTAVKHTIELTLVMLPFRPVSSVAEAAVVEVSRFCPATVSTHRRIHSVALEFGSKETFLSAYKALLWATECNVIEILPGPLVEDDSDEPNYLRLRVAATVSPLYPWRTCLGTNDPNVPKEATYLGSCVDYAVITLAGIADAQEDNSPLKLEDFVIEDKQDGEDLDEDDVTAEDTANAARVRSHRRSSIFTSTFVPDKESTTSTVVGFTSFGNIRRAVSQRTKQVFDVRVLPRNRTRIMPRTDDGAERDASAEDKLLQQDVEAAILMEYISYLPFVSRVYGVLVDEQRYYIFQEPWISALSMDYYLPVEESRAAAEGNAELSRMAEKTAVMSLRDFINGVFNYKKRWGSKEKSADAEKDAAESEDTLKDEAKLQLAHLLASQLLLLITELHGKGAVLGPCPPQRLLVRIVSTEGDKNADILDLPITSDRFQLFVNDLGVSTQAWSYERQQCGVLEFLPPAYIFDHMIAEGMDEQRPWTTTDDWWTLLSVTFELFAQDGTPLLVPPTKSNGRPAAPTITVFQSPTEILNLWRDVVTDPTVPAGQTGNETLCTRVRAYIQKRVMHSVSPIIDAWIVAKSDELEYLGTTAAQQKNRRGVPPQGGAKKKMVGVSLSAAYIQEYSQGASKATSLALEKSENILEDMPWVFHYRDVFDAMTNVCFPDYREAPCNVHGPAMFLFDHPFFQPADFDRIFEGTYELPRDAAEHFREHYKKSDVQRMLKEYRTACYGDDTAPKPRSRQMLLPGGAPYTTQQSPLLLLSSPVYREECTTREMDESQMNEYVRNYSAAEELESGQRQTSMMQVTTPHVSQTPASQAAGAGLLSAQNRLRCIYLPSELQGIAQLENEVRSALFTHQSTARARPQRATIDEEFETQTEPDRDAQRHYQRSLGASSRRSPSARSSHRNLERSHRSARSSHHGRSPSARSQAFEDVVKPAQSLSQSQRDHSSYYATADDDVERSLNLMAAQSNGHATPSRGGGGGGTTSHGTPARSTRESAQHSRQLSRDANNLSTRSAGAAVVLEEPTRSNNLSRRSSGAYSGQAIPKRTGPPSVRSNATSQGGNKGNNRSRRGWQTPPVEERDQFMKF